MAGTIEAATGGCVEKLTSHMAGSTGYELPYSAIREVQLEAMNERFQSRVDKIKLVGFRAEEAGIKEIRRLEDMVPLLLPHTAYKSYPENFLAKKQWGRMTKWLESVSTYSLARVDLDGLAEMDDWVERLAESGHYLACSSGTTGNPALLVSSASDIAFNKDSIVNPALWATAIEPARDRRLFGLAMQTRTPRSRLANGGLNEVICRPDAPPFGFPVEGVTIGSVTRMIVLRKAIAAGTALPAELAEYEEQTARRQQAVEAAIDASATALIEARGEKLHLAGMWGVIHPVAAEVRKRGYSGKDFHPENSIILAGGLKRAQLPNDYKEFVFETFNLHEPFIYNFYSMQELQTTMPRCHAGGRYHLPPWLVCLPLDKAGEALLPGAGEGKVTGRAAFFDLSLDGRWGGIISGDHIEIDYGPCKCGNASPSIGVDIRRYADLEGDDKIACSGTIDAYVRGIG